MTDNPFFKAALSYAQRGWAVFPLAPRTKDPLAGSHGFKDATTDPDIIRAWWRRWPNANIGIATGDPSGVFVLDVDPRNGGDEALRDLERQYGALPESIESLTGGGGRHVLYRWPPGLGCGKLAGGIDVKATGGYIVAPPSIHPTGGVYEWEMAHHPDDVPLAEPPGWLLNLLNNRPAQHSTAQPGDRIPEGQRNSTLTSLAGSMRRRGMGEEAIAAALLAENQHRCDPPLPEDEVRRIAASIARYEPAQDDDSMQKDYGHAAALSQLLKNQYRWAVHRGAWLRYDGAAWRPVPEEQLAKEAADVLRQYYASQLANATDKGKIQDLSKKVSETCIYARISGALSFLKGWPGFLTQPNEWDADPWLLNVKNGTLDLRTLALRPHNPDDLLTKLAPVQFDPKANDTLWRRHIERFLPDPNVRRQVQRDLGAALPGVVLQEVLPIWYGMGANGKTTTTRGLLSVLGDYADRAAPNLLVQSKYERHPTELAELCGLRLAVSAEVDQGKHLAEALVKELTGGDRKRARFMRQDFFSFEQTFSLVLIVNHKPVITGTDDGIWRRVRLIPWEYRIPDAERRPQEVVVNELVSAGSAVLNWLLDGLRDWQADPHWVAPEVQAASEAYRAEMDVLGEFIAEFCVLGPRCRVPKGDLYAAYESWCDRAKERPVTKREFTRLLESRGVGDTREGHTRARCYVGIGLRTNADTFSVSPREAKITKGDMETLSASVRIEQNSVETPNNGIPNIGDCVFLLDGTGVIQNPEPWKILDIVDDPTGQSYALFAETTTGWPLRQCALACDVLEPG